MERIALTLIHLDVNRAPPDIIFGRLFVHDTLVFGATTGLLAREVDEGTRRRDDSALVADGILVKLSNGCVTLELDAIHVEAGLREVLEVATDHCKQLRCELDHLRTS